MKIKALLLLSVIFLCGCGVLQVQPVKPDVTNDFAQIKPIDPNLANVVIPNVPASPQAKTCGDKVCFSKDGLDSLRKMRAVANSNTKTAQQLDQTLKDTITERNTLRELAQQEENRSNFYAKQYADSQNQLQTEQKLDAAKGFVYQTLIVLMAISIAF